MKIKKEICKTLLHYHENGYSLKEAIKKNQKRFTLRFLLLIIFAYLSLEVNLGYLVGLGIIIGGTVQDIGWLNNIKKTWSVSDEITDWNKVKEIITS
jgi:hypothetical protein